MLKYKTIKAFGNLRIQDGVKYTGYIVGDGKSRVFCPADVSKEEAESFFNEMCSIDRTLGTEPVCLVLYR